MAPKPPDLSKETARYEQLVDEIADLADDIEESHKVGVKAQEDSTQAQLFRARLSRLDSCFDKFQARILEIKRLSKLLNSDFATYQTLKEKIYDLFYKTIALGIPSNDDSNIDSHNVTLAESSRHSVNLPRIKVPPFDGNITKWPTFKDTYMSLIHGNSELDATQKFHYLKSSLSGAAAQTIATIEISSAGYTQAWEALLKRFDNKRMLATHHLFKILNYKPITRPNLASLEQFNAVVVESAHAFQNLHLSDPSGFILCLLGLRLLDPQTKERFESKFLNSTTIPGFTEFSDFLQQRYLQLQSNVMTNPNLNVKPPPPARHVMMAVGHTTNVKGNCPICSENHRIVDCAQFRKLSPHERYENLKTLNRCVNCFAKGHKATECQSKSSCRHCKRRHHSLLHFDQKAPTNRSSTKEYPSNQNSSKSRVSGTRNSNMSNPPSENLSTPPVLSAAAIGKGSVLLGTALVRIKNHDGHFVPIRIIIDNGSQRSFITTDCAQRLSLPVKRQHHNLMGLGGQNIPGGSGSTHCFLLPSRSDTPLLKTEAVVIDQISDFLPSSPVPKSISKQLVGYDLADPHFDKPGPIEFLLGADLFGEIILGHTRKLNEGSPVAISTIFGWILIGGIPSASSKESLALFASEPHPSGVSELSEIMGKFWEIEEVSSVSRTDPLELKAEHHFRTTHRRDETGRYIVSLPFKSQPMSFPNTRFGALRRLQNLEQRFTKDASLKADYDKVMREYLAKGYMAPATKLGQCFLPHHGVTKESSTTKLRIVFDASFHSNQGSLNDHLLKGPKLQRDIRDVLLYFRIHRYAMTADIAQMYLQIQIEPQDRVYQHILYRFDSSEAVTEYEFNRLSFGMACSPFLALRVLVQLAQDDGENYPRAIETLNKGIYIDDILTGADTIEEAACLQRELISLLNRGGFELRKWSSNNKQLLSGVAQESHNSPVPLSNLEDSTVKILGMQWEPTLDNLSFRVQLSKGKLSKRGVLSTIARMYDPLGYMSPVIFRAKFILQRIWELRIDWDDPLPGSIATEWETFQNELTHLTDIIIPRCILPHTPKEAIILGFADASSLGYAAAIYLRVESVTGEIFSTLLFSKTRLAPLKPLSIPRLELCAALLLANSLVALKEFIDTLNVTSVYLFSDASTVLSWLRTPLHQLKIFVANRVAKLLELTSPESWYHIPSGENAADLPSRGIAPSLLSSHPSWWQGPSWVRRPFTDWPIKKLHEYPLDSDIPETKPGLVLLNHEESASPDEFFKPFSSYRRLVRVYALALRFIHNARSELSIRRKGSLTLPEMKEASLRLIKLVQSFYFPNEIADNNDHSKLQSLRPFLDSRGLLRVGGRLQNAPISFEAKHPILLPHRSHFVNLLVDHHHIIYLHAGPQLLHSLLRRSYWITSARQLVRSRVHSCIKCHRMRAKNFQPLMGNLPLSRFEQGRPFINVGVDFAGPFLIRESTRRKAKISKAYFSIFVCFSTKAVHVELVSELTTAAFLACLDRFIARRGLPSQIFSDNATNFVGAQRRLKELYGWFSQATTQDQVNEHLLKREIQWNFIPPAAPHFGGLWEAAVKSLKCHLVRVAENQPMTFEELTTLGSMIEAILNSRPLYPISSSPEDFSVLTPGHFIIGEPLLAIPQPDWSGKADHLLTRWQFLQKCIKDIWKRWKTDYLSCLHQRTKWTRDQNNLTKDTLVLLKDPNQEPLKWPTGRVLEVYPGKDDVVRVAKIKTATGEYIRPVARLVPLFPETMENLV